MMEHRKRQTTGLRGEADSKLSESSAAPKQEPVAQAGKPKKSSGRCVRFLVWSGIVWAALLGGLCFSHTMQRSFIYLHWLRLPLTGNLSDPLSYDVQNARNVEIVLNSEVTLKGWHMAPFSHKLSDVTDGKYFGEEDNVIIYFHGNMGTRALGRRRDLYRRLRESFGVHVVTFDYRGFADSTGTPTEEGLIQDAIAVYDFVRASVRAEKIHVWGHSLGTGVASALAHHVSTQRQDLFHSLVLEAPFFSLIDAAKSYPLSYPFRFKRILDLVDEYMIDKFLTHERLMHVKMPVLVMHGTSDRIIPHTQSVQLIEKLMTSEGVAGPKPVLELFEDVDHISIVAHPKWESVVRKFWKKN